MAVTRGGVMSCEGVVFRPVKLNSFFLCGSVFDVWFICSCRFYVGMF